MTASYPDDSAATIARTPGPTLVAPVATREHLGGRSSCQRDGGFIVIRAICAVFVPRGLAVSATKRPGQRDAIQPVVGVRHHQTQDLLVEALVVV